MNTQNKAHFTSKTEEWETPPELFEKLNREFGFTLDPCATQQNAKVSKYYTKQDDGLAKSWAGERVWMNPPYGRIIRLWCYKAWLSVGSPLKMVDGDRVVSHPAELVVGLLPARTDTKWFHCYIRDQAEIRFLPGRVGFLSPSHTGRTRAPFPSMIVIWRRK